MDPAAGISRASRPILQAHSRQATSAKITDSGNEPPANSTPAGIDAAIAAPGAMSVMLCNSTSRRPIASLRSPVCVAAGAVAVIAASVPHGNGRYGDDPTVWWPEIALLSAH